MLKWADGRVAFEVVPEMVREEWRIDLGGCEILTNRLALSILAATGDALVACAAFKFTVRHDVSGRRISIIGHRSMKSSPFPKLGHR